MITRTLVAAILFAITIRTQAAITFGITFDDPGSTYSSFYSSIQSNLLAAAQDWASKLSGNASLELKVNFDVNANRAGGRSATVSYVNTVGGINVFEQGMAAELKTGVDPNGTTPDGEIVIQPSYLMNELWFDPNPTSRVQTVPADRTDAVSVFIHELGHAFAFNGYRSSTDGTLPSNYETTFDQNTSFDLTNFYFNGPSAMSLYGGPVPVTYGNNFHVGNQSPRPGSDLIPDLMNGIVFNRGLRYDISALDLAILKDSGVSLIPEPSNICLLIFGGLLHLCSAVGAKVAR